MQFATGSEDFIPTKLEEELDLAHSGCNGKWLPITKDPMGLDVPTNNQGLSFVSPLQQGILAAKCDKGI